MFRATVATVSIVASILVVTISYSRYRSSIGKCKRHLDISWFREFHSVDRPAIQLVARAPRAVAAAAIRDLRAPDIVPLDDCFRKEPVPATQRAPCALTQLPATRHAPLASLVPRATAAKLPAPRNPPNSKTSTTPLRVRAARSTCYELVHV